MDVLALLGRLSSLVQVQERLATLDSENRFERQLFRQADAKVGKVLVELKAAALELGSRSTALMAFAHAEPSYQTLLRFFRAFESIAEHRTPGQNLRELPPPEEGIRALEAVIDSTYRAVLDADHDSARS